MGRVLVPCCPFSEGGHGQLWQAQKRNGIDLLDCELLVLAEILDCNIGRFPFTYLGLIVGVNMNFVKKTGRRKLMCLNLD